jgi:hypothetical protein
MEETPRCKPPPSDAPSGDSDDRVTARKRPLTSTALRFGRRFVRLKLGFGRCITGCDAYRDRVRGVRSVRLTTGTAADLSQRRR